MKKTHKLPRTLLKDLTPGVTPRFLADDELLAVGGGCSWLTEKHTADGGGYCTTDYPKVM